MELNLSTLIALLNLSSWCLVMVERLFLVVPWGCLQFVIVVFPDHTHLLFLDYRRKRYDIIQVFKIIHKIDDIDMSKFFTFTDNSQLRGHNLKLN